MRATTLGVLLFATGCATVSVPPLRSEFGDVPMMDGLSYQADQSVIIETRNVRTARLVYRGRMEAGSAVVEMQKGLEANGWIDAFGNAGTQAAGLWQVRHEPIMSKQLHNGRAAHAGLLAADLARIGFTGPSAILEGPQGFFAAMCPGADPHEIVR